MIASIYFGTGGRGRFGGGPGQGGYCGCVGPLYWAGIVAKPERLDFLWVEKCTRRRKRDVKS